MHRKVVWFGMAIAVVFGGYGLILAMQPDEKQNSIEYTGEPISFTSTDQQVFNLQYSTDNEFVKLTTTEGVYELTRVVSASGVKYMSEDESILFWEHQGEAAIEINGETVVAQGEQISIIETTMPPTALTNNSWQWQETQYSDGSVVIPIDSSDFTITFSFEGNFSATTDCNNQSGSYVADESIGSIEFGPIASTVMACPNTESLEATFANMLSEVTGYLITPEGNLALTLQYDSGSIIFIPAKVISESETLPEEPTLPAGAVSFSGTLEAVSTACYADGICLAIIDGKRLELIVGWSRNTVGEVRFDNHIDGLEKYIGNQVDVVAAQTENGYTLYGSTEYYIQPAL